MLKHYLLILLLLMPQNGLALEAKLFDDKTKFYFVLTNESESTIEVAESLVLGHCDYFANICLRVVDGQMNEIVILAKPMNFDIQFKKRVKVRPAAIYGISTSKQTVIKRYGLKSGCFLVSLIYQDKKLKIVVESPPITFGVIDSKAINKGQCKVK